MNSKGQIMIELLFYLIIILLILSVVIYLMATLDDNQVTRINSRELNNILEDSIATLTETTGSVAGLKAKMDAADAAKKQLSADEQLLS